MRSQRGKVSVATIVLASILGLIVLAAIVVGGYQLHWWLYKQDVNRSAKINRSSYEVQQTYHEEVLKDLTKVADLDAQIANPAYADSAAANRSARTAQIRQTCDHISRLTISGAGLDPDIQSFHDRECIVP